MNKESSAHGGIGFTGVLTILFIALKLTHHIDWSWWWVLSPIWIAAILVSAIIIMVLVVGLVYALLTYKEKK